MAVLLDKFVTATAEMEAEEQQLVIDEVKKKKQARFSPHLTNLLVFSTDCI